jgi:thymidylate synthase ThyX
MMDIILNKRENRELEHINFRFQIPISLSILTHLTRHRMHSLLVPEFVKMWDLNNYIIPNTIKVNYEDKYNEIFDSKYLKDVLDSGAEKMRDVFKKKYEVMKDKIGMVR